MSLAQKEASHLHSARWQTSIHRSPLFLPECTVGPTVYVEVVVAAAGAAAGAAAAAAAGAAAPEAALAVSSLKCEHLS